MVILPDAALWLTYSQTPVSVPLHVLFLESQIMHFSRYCTTLQSCGRSQIRAAVKCFACRQIWYKAKGTPLLLSALSLLYIFFICMGKLPPALEAEPEVVELVHCCVSSLFVSHIRHRLCHRPPAVALEGRPKHLHHNTALPSQTVAWQQYFSLRTRHSDGLPCCSNLSLAESQMHGCCITTADAPSWGGALPLCKIIYAGKPSGCALGTIGQSRPNLMAAACAGE